VTDLEPGAIARDAANAADYGFGYRIFRHLYPATRALMHRLAAQT